MHALLDVDRLRDYGPNGVQVEGKPDVHKLVSGVTASLAPIDAAVDAHRVRHGLSLRDREGWMMNVMNPRLARTTGVCFLACDHCANEPRGAHAPGEHLAGMFGPVRQFIDLPNRPWPSE